MRTVVTVFDVLVGVVVAMSALKVRKETKVISVLFIILLAANIGLIWW